MKDNGINLFSRTIKKIKDSSIVNREETSFQLSLEQKKIIAEKIFK